MIRFIERKENGELYYRSGGGLTVYSDPEAEYQELNDKIYVPVNRDYTSRTEGTEKSTSARGEDQAIATDLVRR